MLNGWYAENEKKRKTLIARHSWIWFCIAYYQYFFFSFLILLSLSIETLYSELIFDYLSPQLWRKIRVDQNPQLIIHLCGQYSTVKNLYIQTLERQSHIDIDFKGSMYPSRYWHWSFACTFTKHWGPVTGLPWFLAQPSDVFSSVFKLVCF